MIPEFLCNTNVVIDGTNKISQCTYRNPAVIISLIIIIFCIYWLYHNKENKNDNKE